MMIIVSFLIIKRTYFIPKITQLELNGGNNTLKPVKKGFEFI